MFFFEYFINFTLQTNINYKKLSEVKKKTLKKIKNLIVNVEGNTSF